MWCTIPLWPVLAQTASVVMHGFEMEKEIFGSSKVLNFVADLHSSVVVDARRFACERVESRLPICFGKCIA